MHISGRLIRLVKDFLGDNYNKFEDIHGRLYETKLFASEGEECNQVWTMVNVDIADYEHDLVPTPMPESATSAITSEYAYYVNRWDGKKWDKHEMVEGDCIVLVSEEKAYDDRNRVDEYRLERDLDGKLYLVNMDEFWQTQIDDIVSGTSEAIEKLQDEIDELSGATQELRSDLDEVSAATEALEEIVGEGLSGETLTDAIIELREDLADEISARTEADEILQENIDAEASARTAADEELHDMITAETQAREEEDERLWEALSAETEERKAADDELWEALSAETQAREEADEVLQENIDKEASARTEADQEIRDSIGKPSDVPVKQLPDGTWSNSSSVFDDDDFRNGNITVFGFINASNDYGYNLDA